jgi:tetratricopeptide (TPR) repeat protein
VIDMMRFPTRRHSLLAAAVAAVLALGAVVPAQAQSAQERAAARKAEKEARQKGGETKQEQIYPNATRQSPEARASNKGGPKLQKLIDTFNEDQFAQARTMADELLANSAMNPYEHAFAAQMAAQAAYSLDDNAAAIAYLNKAIELNALDNNNHFNAMLMRAQMQLSDDATLAQGLASLDQFLTESGSTNPDHLAIKGQALYQLEKHAEAAEIFKKLVDTTPEPKDQWLSLLMSSYADLGRTDEAVALAERLAAKDPADKKKQMNLAAVYSQADKYDKAAAVLEKLRAAGQLTEERDYKVLYSTYLNMEGREKDVATVIDEGLDKGVLKPEYQVYLALAQSYYFSEQNAPAIDAYRKAAPLAPDGETYLNLARLLWQEDRIPEAKEAAKQALAKGLKKPDDAKKILALPAK